MKGRKDGYMYKMPGDVVRSERRIFGVVGYGYLVCYSILWYARKCSIGIGNKY